MATATLVVAQLKEVWATRGDVHSWIGYSQSVSPSLVAHTERGDMTGSTYLMKVLNRLEKYQIENGTRKRIEVTYIPTRDEYVKVEGLGNRLYWKPF